MMNSTERGISSASLPHSSLEDTWAYFVGLTNAEKLRLIEQLRSHGISESDLKLLYSQLDTDENLAFLHIPEYRVYKALMLWVPPILLFMGTVGNACSFAVLRQKTMRQQSIYMYFCALAVFDSLVLYVGLLRLWLGEVTGTDIRNISPWMCKVTLMLGYTCSDVSVWLIVAVTVERYIVVCHPLRAKAFCQQPRAKLIIVGIVLVFSLLNLHLLVSTSLVEMPHSSSMWALISTESPDVSRDMTCGPLPGYGPLVNVVWPWVDAILYGIGPFIVISVLNTCIILKVFRANNSRASLINGDGRMTTHLAPHGQNSAIRAGDFMVSSAELSHSIESSDLLKATSDNLMCGGVIKASNFSPMLSNSKPPSTRKTASGSLRMTIMLLSVSFTFMLTTLPMTISNILANTVINTNLSSDKTVAQGLLVHTLALLLMYLNHSINFLLYCVTGKKFRKVVTRMYSAKMCALIQRKASESNPMDHSDHLYCSRGNATR